MDEMWCGIIYSGKCENIEMAMGGSCRWKLRKSETNRSKLEKPSSSSGWREAVDYDDDIHAYTYMASN